MADYDVVIIGGGISGLAALHYIRTRRPELSVRLFEADGRLGGTVGTDHCNGYSLDWGPNGFLDREPLTLQLVDEIALSAQLERANANVSNRFILRLGKLRAVPMKPQKFLTSDILSLPGKLRVLGEPFAAKAPEGVDESIYDFGKRRIGREAADYLIQPMVSGVYGGVASRMSLRACFPMMYQMESQYGSLFKAMLAKMKEAKRNGKKSGGPSGPAGWLTSFKGGLSRITDELGSRYASDIALNRPVLTVQKNDSGFQVRFTDSSTVDTRDLILAVPSNHAAMVTGELSSELSKTLAAIPYAPIAVVCFGYDASRIRTNLDGFGFLVPSKEGKGILGSIWTSSIFADRAPQGKVQFRTMVGGDGDHESAKLSDGDLIARVTRDLDSIVGLNGEPELVKIYRWEYGIPQYHIGHLDRMQVIERELAAIKGLHLTGNAYYGISLNDCVKQSFKVVGNLTI
ncbi:protoporphyrinogen oxidase [candidate division GN15 bacterium]|uniref:Coproporphyrinogen III oxidase n=1 Tax=candidate division GN15 bacterium TaxID=2072418 RepID=A0A855X5E5_9BACT|nr:MAG: protoporphyrinogen oxidase [candidate division GN15 bacterium]